MEISGLFWIVASVMAIGAFGFVASPLFKNNRKAALITAAIAVPLLAVGLYLQLGSPGAASAEHLPGQRQTAAAGSSESAASEKIGSVASMVDGLATRLREDPTDAGSWLLLARSYGHLGRTDDAIDAYNQAVALGQYDADLAALSVDVESTQSVVGAQIFGIVKLSEEASAIVQPSDTVFIFAKAVDGPAAPLAVLQRAASELPIDFLLNDSQSMIAGMKLSDFDKVVVTARITRDGDATTALQGLEAKSETILVAENRHLNLTIE
jgi:tetratricopeptide (TPR) repeat protein